MMFNNSHTSKKNLGNLCQFSLTTMRYASRLAALSASFIDVKKKRMLSFEKSMLQFQTNMLWSYILLLNINIYLAHS